MFVLRPILIATTAHTALLPTLALSNSISKCADLGAGE
jgi:hypothetical protein